MVWSLLSRNGGQAPALASLLLDHLELGKIHSSLSPLQLLCYDQALCLSFISSKSDTTGMTHGDIPAVFYNRVWCEKERVL